MELKFNFSFDAEGELQKSKEKAKNAQQKKLDSEESESDAFRRILSMKNSDTDKARILEVYEAIKEKKVERRAEDLGKKLSKAEVLRLYKELSEIKRLEKLEEISRNIPKNYHQIDNVIAFDKLLAYLKDEPIVAVDTETTGLDTIHGDDELVGISITLPKKNVNVYIPVGHDKGVQLKRDFVLNGLKAFLTDSSIGKIFHNLKFDYHVFYKYGVRMKNVYCTQVMMHVLTENLESQGGYGLKHLTAKLGYDTDTFEDLFGKDARFNAMDLSTGIPLYYACKDTYLTWKLFEYQMNYFKKMPKLYDYYMKVEKPLTPVLAEMEQTGFLLDTTKSMSMARELDKKIQALQIKLVEYFGSININSHQQLKPAIEKIVGKKIESTDAKKVLKPLSKQFVEIKTLLEYKELEKLRSTYVDALPQKVKNDGRIHPSFGQANTVTGRLNSSGPNFQNLPKDARKMFIAPEGWVILSGDFGSQEPRILATFSKEPRMIQAFEEGKDVYATLASSVFNKPYEQCLDGTFERKAAKQLLLAVMYGISPSGVSDAIGVTKKKAEQIIEDFYKTHPTVRKWMDEQIEICKKQRYIEMLFGRKRRLPDINSKDKWERLRNERQCINAIIQGSASVQTKMTMIKLHEFCERKGWKMLFSIHDEVGVLAPEHLTPEDVKEFEEIMLSTVKIGVPNRTDLEISVRWGEGYHPDVFFRDKVRILLRK